MAKVAAPARKPMLDFLLNDDPPESPLPILGDRNNTVRVDPEEPIWSTGIYRDLWERKDLPPDASDWRLGDVWVRDEYPTTEDWERSRRQAVARKVRIELATTGEVGTRRKELSEREAGVLALQPR